MLEGYWSCYDEEHMTAEPRCPDTACEQIYPTSYILEHRSEIIWTCPSCGMKAKPICCEHGIGNGPEVKWERWDD